MTLGEAITRTQEIKPSQYGPESMALWLYQLDETIYKEVVLNHEDASEPVEPYDPEADRETTLLVPPPYDGIYMSWLAAKIDFHNAEYGRYNNDMIMYNTQYNSFVDWYNREHKPVSKNYVRI